MHKFLSVLIILAVAFSMSVVEARIVVPTADVLPDGQASIGYYLHRGTNYLNARLGMFDDLEVGLTGVISEQVQLRTNLQLAAMKEAATTPGVGLGVEIEGSRVGLYGVVSKQLGLPGLRGHLAWGTGRYSRGMVGVTALLNPVQVTSSNGRKVPTMSAALEYDGHGLNTGVIAQFSPDFSGHLYLSDFKSLGVGVRYRIAF